jgi:crossover junction endodeoxyribonuclease RuvC
MKRAAFIGVDPGLSGALAIVNGFDTHLRVEDMPTMTMMNGKRRIDMAALAALLEEWRNWNRDRALLATVEDVHSMPGQGVSSVFSFGFSAGALQQALASAEIPVKLVQPATWKALYGLRGGRDNKTASRDKATELYPRHAAMWARVKDDGRAEAVLLANYGSKLSWTK